MTLTPSEIVTIRSTQTWTREQYEAMCQRHGERAWEDRRIPSIRQYNDDVMSPLYAFAVARHRGMLAEAAAHPAPAPAPAPATPARACEMCGRQTRHLMTSAHGSVCPDCYDDAND